MSLIILVQLREYLTLYCKQFVALSTACTERFMIYGNMFWYQKHTRASRKIVHYFKSREIGPASVLVVTVIL